MLHRQDIYKILPILEKKGLITKTISKPFKIHAVPLETALYQLVLHEKEKADEKINALKCTIKNLVEALKEPQEKEEDVKFTLLTTDETIENSFYKSIQSVKEIKVIADPEILFSPLARVLQDKIDSVLQKKIRVKALLEVTTENIGATVKMFEKLNLNKTKVFTKRILQNTMKHYLILDDKEVWIATEQKTESGFPNIFWTNDSNIVQVYEEYFCKGWNDIKAVMLYPKNDFKKNEHIVAS